MSANPLDQAHLSDSTTTSQPVADPGPLGDLPRVSYRQSQLDARLARVATGAAITSALAWLSETAGASVSIDQPEVVWHASGMQRPGVVAHFSCPRLASRFGLGVETPIAHAVVDRLLGFERLPAGTRLQVTPVEWGILAFVVAETLARVESDDRPGALGPWDFTLDRLGSDPLNLAGLGSVVTLRWPVTIGLVSGSLRLWVPEALIALWLASVPPPAPELIRGASLLRGRFADLAGLWHAEAGTVLMPRGLGKLRVGGVLPIDSAALHGTPESPSGTIELALTDRDARSSFSAEPVPGSAGHRLTLTAPLRRRRITREALAVDASHDPAPANATSPVQPHDVPVTLAVELGRINLSLGRLADLKPGDVVELGHHAREPVELTSGGRLIARGELVQIDTELGVRVLSVFL